jgi:hypothetical protein
LCAVGGPARKPVFRRIDGELRELQIFQGEEPQIFISGPVAAQNDLLSIRGYVESYDERVVERESLGIRPCRAVLGKQRNAP